MKIAFFGDSLTEGRPGAAYLPLLARLLPHHESLNLGRAGDGAADLLRRVVDRGLDPVDLAFIWVGVNDAVMGAWDPAGATSGAGSSWDERVARFRADYETLLEWTAARTSLAVCVRPLVLESEGSVWEKHADALGDVVAGLARARGRTRVLDLRPAFAAATESGREPFTTDGVHFTEAGAVVVAAAFAAVIEAIEHRAAHGRGGPDMKSGLRIGLIGAATAAAGIGVWAGLRPRLLAWGATCDEVVRPLPGDDLVANPLYVTTRALTLKAPAADVWPWLVQLGQNRGGFYTYDALENLMGLDIHSAEAIHPEWQDLAVGEDYIALDPQGTMKMTIALLEPERAFVVLSGAPGEPPQEPGSFFKGELELELGLRAGPSGLQGDAAPDPLPRRLGGHAGSAPRPTSAPGARALPHGGAHAAGNPRARGAGVPYMIGTDGRVFFREAGDPGRPLLVLLPDSMASSASYEAEMLHFGRRFHVAALDFLGTGQSDRLRVWTPDWWERGALQAATLATRLGAARYAVMGAGGGGIVALLTALRIRSAWPRWSPTAASSAFRPPASNGSCTNAIPRPAAWPASGSARMRS